MSSDFLKDRKKLYLSILIFLAGVVAGLPTLRQNFFGDDTILIIENPDVRSLKNIPNLFRKDFFDRPIVGLASTNLIGYYRPLTKTSFALDWSIWGRNPAGYHFTNILVHACVGLFIFLILIEFGVALDIAAWMAVLFAVFPTHDQAISLINARSDLLCALGLSIVAWATIRRNLLLSIIGSLICLFSKEQGVFAIFIVFAVILSLKNQRVLYRKIVIATFLCIFGYFLLRNFALLSTPVQPTSIQSILTQSNFILAGKLVEVQALLSMGIDPNHLSILLIPDSMWNAQVFLGWLLISGLFVGLVGSFLYRRRVFLPLSFLFVGVIPMLAVHRLSMPLGNVIVPVMDRWSYLPSVGIFLWVGILSCEKKVPKHFKTLFALGSILFLASLWLKLPTYNDEKSFNLRVLKTYQQKDEDQLPPKLRVERLGMEAILLFEKNEIGKALELLKKANQIDPDNVFVQANMGKMYADIGDYDRAIRYLRQSLSLTKIYSDGDQVRYRVTDGNARDRPQRYAMLGEVYRRAGIFDESEVALRMALRGDPTNPNYLNNLAVAIGSQHRITEAMEIYLQVLEMDPCHRQAHEAIVSVLQAAPNPSFQERFDRVSRGCPSRKTLDLTR